MGDSLAVKRAILEAHIGAEVTAVLGGGGQSGVFQGVLQKEILEMEGSVDAWVIVSPRGLVRQGGTPTVIPKTKVFFSADQLGHLLARQETQEEAIEKIKKEEAEADTKARLVAPGGRIMQ